MMQIGIKRKIDNLGRIVIPKELRTFYQFMKYDEVEVVAVENGVLIRKPEYEVKKIDHKQQ